MFNQTFGEVTIKVESMPKRGECLHISKADGQYILADCFGMNPTLVPDGTNAYLFGNKLIVVTRWADMSEDEIDTVENDEIIFAIHPYKCVQFSINLGGNWGDVMTNLHNFSKYHNDANRPVDEIIFIFADTHDSDYVSSRLVKLPKPVQKLLQKSNQNSLKTFSLDDKLESIKYMAMADPNKDEFDIMYDLCFEATKDMAREAQKCEPADVPGGVYITIDEYNDVVDLYRNEEEEEIEEEAEPEISKEVKQYMFLAEKGSAVGQHALAYSYERGEGIEQNIEKAIYWCTKAAEQGNDRSQFNLGLYNYKGFGMDQDLEEAARYFTLSAKQGNMHAQYFLGMMLKNGEGIKKDKIKAFYYLSKAAKGGHPEAKEALKNLGK